MRVEGVRMWVLFGVIALAGAATVNGKQAADPAAAPQEDAPPQGEAPQGPFGLTRLTTASGEPASINDFFLSSDCALCHPRQWQEMRGSMHSVAHEDRFYRGFAELARREAGEEVYRYCSGCHSPAGVVTGLIPSVPEEELPEVARAGVTCDVCHQVSELSGHGGPWKEPGNASLVLDPGRVKGGTLTEIERNPAHQGRAHDFYSKSEFCASCHTVIHPLNGLRIEHTYAEWKGSIYAEKGIQCQDCHMRTVEDAITVASTLKPVSVRDTWARKGPVREIAPHYFVGGNVEADILAQGSRHARMAEQRLKSAATMSLEVLEEVIAGEEFTLEVKITNVGAGHDLPTSLTEVRQMWLHVRVSGPSGELLFESGALDAAGELMPGTVRFGSEMIDGEGRVTHRPWEAQALGWKRTIPAKGSDSESYTLRLPSSLQGALEVEARLLYRIASPEVIELAMGDGGFEPRVIEMASASRQLKVVQR